MISRKCIDLLELEATLHALVALGTTMMMSFIHLCFLFSQSEVRERERERIERAIRKIKKSITLINKNPS